MVNKRFWLGILAMVLVFGMSVIGCDPESTDDDDVVDTTPSTPTGLSGIADGNSVLLTWESVANASEYLIEYKKSIENYKVVNSTSTNYTFTDLDSNTEYSFRVAAQNTKGEKSGYSYVFVETSNPKTGTVSLSLSTTHTESMSYHSYSITVKLELSNGSLWEWESDELSTVKSKLQTWVTLTPPSGFSFASTSGNSSGLKTIYLIYTSYLNASPLAAPNLTATIDQSKLSEMKGYTNITESLTVGTPSTASSTAWVDGN